MQADEYGNGDPAGMHAALFGDTMECLGLDRHPNAYLAAIPRVTLVTTNLISMLGLHRRLRGALLGHVALFEMTSIGPMARYDAVLRRLGPPIGWWAAFCAAILAWPRTSSSALGRLVGSAQCGVPTAGTRGCPRRCIA